MRQPVRLVTQKPRRSAFRRYALAITAVVVGVLLASGGLQFFFSLQESEAALARIQHEKAVNASLSIKNFLGEVGQQILWSAPPAGAGSLIPPEQRREGMFRLLRQVPAVTDVSYLDASGREQMRVSRRALNVAGSGADHAGDASFRAAQAGATFYSPVYFRDDSEPYLTVAVPELGEPHGVTVAEVNLKLVWDVVSSISQGTHGQAYVVDSTGALVAHPDIGLVLRKTDLSSLAQVQAGLANLSAGVQPPRAASSSAIEAAMGMLARNHEGRQVLTAYEVIDPPGWLVFVEQPIEEAFAPAYASIERTFILLALGLVLSVIASVALARSMVRPIQALQVSAARIGAGELDQRIEIATGDELESLAEELNRMAAHLQDLYAGLEEKVQDRTRELAETLRELHQKTRELELTSQHKSDFLASMSHELRTPLHAIIGFSQVLLQQMFGDLNPKQREHLTEILESGRHLLALINEVLDLSKVEAGHAELEVAPFSLEEVLENGLAMVRERAGRQGISLSLEVDPAIDLLGGDERRVKQIIFNLLSNAVKFTPSGGRVSVSATPAGEDAVRVLVADTGIGIDREDQAFIFDAFYQGRGSAAIAQEGTGLGLALARKFVDLHGGQMWVTSEPGRGSVFGFTLPTGLVASPSPQPSPAKGEGERPSSEPSSAPSHA